jgi:hypothetical protein
VQGALNNWRWDTENPAPSQEFGLIRFDGIMGSGPGQIPAGSTIDSATLTLEVTNGSVAPAGTMNESAVDWSEATATWNNFGGEAGVQTDEFLASPAYTAPIATGSVGTSVTASVQAWASGTRSNFGWVFRPNSNDGMQVNSAEFATVALRPRLSVTYVAPAAGCTDDGQCNDNDPCNGVETCVGGACQSGAPLSCDDGNVCTTDSCAAPAGCQHANNTASCSDGNACTVGDACASGSCVPGAAASCDDGNVCTDDGCNPGSGCTHANNAAPCPDALFCNGQEVCSAGTCQPGMPVDCSDGLACSPDTCNEALDLCEHAQCAVTVAAAGSRWLAVTPPSGLSSVALRLGSGALGCLPLYVDATGALTGAPVFRSSAQWGTVYVGDRAVVPGTAYTVQAEVTAGVPIGSGTASTLAWGDTNGTGGVDLFDLVCVLDGSLGTFTTCSPQSDDHSPGPPVRPALVDLVDVQAVLDAFSGTAYPDFTPCGSGK